jgi:hypothetical protein
MSEQQPKRRGRPTKAAEPMQPRQIRMTDQQWSDAQFVGPDWIRAAVTKEAARRRKSAG